MELATQVDSLWLLAIASKCKSFTPLNTLILALIFLVICLILFWAHPGGPAWGRLRLTCASRPIPGPRGLPLIGSINLMTGLAHRSLAAAAEACGAKRLMAFSIGETRALVTCNPDVAKEILASSAFVDRPPKESAHHLMFNRSMGFAPYGFYWTTLRKIAATHLFCPKQIKASDNQRLEIAKQMVSELTSNMHDMIAVRDVLKFASLNNMMLSVFGRKYDRLDSETAELRELVDEGYYLLGEVNWSDHFSFLGDLDLQKIRFRCSRLVPRVKRLIGRIIQERKTDQTKNSSYFVDVLLSLQGPDRLSDSDIISVLWEMIFRGTDTVAVVIEWILARLVLHPNVQSKVHDELDKVVGKSRAVTESDLTALVYITGVIKEVLRMHPPGPLLSWARMSIRDSTVDGYHVPSGTTAMVNMWAITTDPDIWPDADHFKPERFLDGNHFSVMGSDLRLAPFGSGRRSCPGKSMGMATVTYWVATLLHEFEFHCGNKTGVDLEEVLRLSCEMANPLVVRVRPRRCPNVQ